MQDTHKTPTVEEKMSETEGIPNDAVKIEEPEDADEEEKEETKKLLGYLRSVELTEKHINKYIQEKLMPGTGIKPHQVYFHLAIRETFYISHIVPGPQIQVYIAWPEAVDHFHTIIGRALAEIAARKLITPVEIQSYALVQEYKKKNREYVRKSFGDFAEMLMDILDQDRIKLSRTTIRRITAKDKITGIETYIESSDDNETDWGLKQRVIMKLSRLVKEIEEPQVVSKSTDLTKVEIKQ